MMMSKEEYIGRLERIRSLSLPERSKARVALVHEVHSRGVER